MTPKSMVEQAKQDLIAFEDFLFDFVTMMEKEGKAPSYIEVYLKTVKSWLLFNSIKLVRRIKIGNTGRTPTIENERIPTKEELNQILGYAKPRGKVSICFMGFSGLRPQVLGNYTGIDGLVIGDLPEITIEDKTVGFEKMPTMVVVRPELSKAKHRYLTFLGPEGCQQLKAYIEKRLASGE
ncbi:MAG: site-specific integrase, partial [Candidatus Bathyarchaeota archaeon]